MEEQAEQEQSKQDQKWLQQIKKHPVATVFIALLAVVIVLVILVILGYIFNWDWTGLTATNITSTPQNITKTITYQPEKTLWDWLQLLIIPAVLAVAGYVINLTISRGEQAATEQRAKTERTIALDNQQEAALQAYIDKISELLLKEHLGERRGDDIPELLQYEQVRKIARVRTITVLTQLDARRISYVFAFLREAGLISTAPNDNVVSLRHADLRKVNWSQANLSEANLSEANLSEADLTRVNLYNADLSNADLTRAKLSNADLRYAKLSNAKLTNADLRDANLSSYFGFGEEGRRTAIGTLLNMVSGGPDLTGAILITANLTGAILSTANLSNAQFWEADLSNANLESANLSNADFRQANLSNANLYRADLSNVHFWEVNLSNADLEYANLKGAFGITVDELEKQTKSLEGATMPNGSIHR